MALRNMTGLLAARLSQVTSAALLAPFAAAAVANANLQQVRFRRKHWDPKWKKMRALKVVKVDLPEFGARAEQVTQEQTRAKMKERGILPPRPWVERPLYISTTGGVFEPYVPPEGDGRVSPISTQGAKQKFELLEKKTKSMLAVRKIRSYEEDFDATEFCRAAQEIYVRVHECMMRKDYEGLSAVVTERAHPEAVHNVRDKTIHWRLLSWLEDARVVHARCTDIVSKDNVFAQVTVRLHSQQLLAVYDRFGRLQHGSELLAKDVLEYVVFEKHLSNEYGVWRLHDRLRPAWQPARAPATPTRRSSPLVNTD